MEYANIKLEREDAIAIVTLNRPESLNSINYPMRDEIRHFFSGLITDTDLRVIVLTGAGKGFCSGLDIKDSSIMSVDNQYTPKRAYEYQQMFSDFILFMRRCPQPIIGAINGAAVGAGLSMALACDVRLASPKAKFGAAYINLGFGGADMGGSWLFPKAVGLSNAARYMLTGDIFDAEEAYRIGLVQALVEPERLLDETMSMARNMASKSPLGLRVTKEALNHNSSGVSLEDAIRFEDRNQALTIAELALKLAEMNKKEP